MTNQTQPLTLKLSNGQEVPVPTAKSILRFTENGQQHNCAIIQGPQGVAVYNIDGDAQINGAPSSTHWLQPGDQLQLGPTMTASVQQLGRIENSVDSLLPEQVQPAATASVQPAPTPVPAPTEQGTFTPATAADTFVPELPTVAPVAAPAAPMTPSVANSELPSTQADLAAPVVTAAAHDASAMSVAEDDRAELNTPIAPQPTDPDQAEISGFAADLLARIRSDENGSVGTPNSESTHSLLATDGPSFSSQTTDTSIESLNPALPPNSAVIPVPETQLPVEPTLATPEVAEATTVESSDPQTQNSSVSALLERMKSEGQWDGIPEETQPAPASPEPTPVTPEVSAAPAEPVANQPTDDVENYMSQLLSRMRGPDAQEQQSVPEVTQVVQPQAIEQVVEKPKSTKLLKPEEYVPKSRAKRLESLQEMRALANTQTRTAINRSQAKRREEYSDYINLFIAVTSFIVAAFAFLTDSYGSISFTTGIIVAITGVFFCYKTFCSKPAKAEQSGVAQTSTEPVEELV